MWKMIHGSMVLRGFSVKFDQWKIYMHYEFLYEKSTKCIKIYY